MHEGISIHSTARVETSWPPAADDNAVYFNPLHREGGDRMCWQVPAQATQISIHSTARVETRAYYAGLEAGHNFNPLHREGGDHRKRQIRTCSEIFGVLL